MAESTLVLRHVTAADIDAYVEATLKGFNEGPWQQVPYYNVMMPLKPGTSRWLRDSYLQQFKTQKRSAFIMVIDTAANDKIVGVSKWLAPDEEPVWTDFDEVDMNVPMASEFFSAMDEHREHLMGHRPHWYLEVMAVDAAYQRRGIGKMMMDWGCSQIDNEGSEAYVDGTPLGSGLYAKYGFIKKESQSFSAPWDFMTLSFMVRPAKT